MGQCPPEVDSPNRRSGVAHFLGRFDDKREAARAYNGAAIQHFGEFAYLLIFSKVMQQRFRDSPTKPSSRWSPSLHY